MMFMFRVQGWDLGLGVTGVGCFGVEGVVKTSWEDKLLGRHIPRSSNKTPKRLALWFWGGRHVEQHLP